MSAGIGKVGGRIGVGIEGFYELGFEVEPITSAMFC